MELDMQDLEKMYDEFLDEVYPEQVKVATYSFSTSYALKELDKVAYNQGFNEWLDYEIGDFRIFEHQDGTYHDEDEDEKEALDKEFYKAYEASYEKEEMSPYAKVLFDALKP